MLGLSFQVSYKGTTTFLAKCILKKPTKNNGPPPTTLFFVGLFTKALIFLGFLRIHLAKNVVVPLYECWGRAGGGTRGRVPRATEQDAHQQRNTYFLFKKLFFLIEKLLFPILLKAFRAFFMVFRKFRTSYKGTTTFLAKCILKKARTNKFF